MDEVRAEETSPYLKECSNEVSTSGSVKIECRRHSAVKGDDRKLRDPRGNGGPRWEYLSAFGSRRSWSLDLDTYQHQLPDDPGRRT